MPGRKTALMFASMLGACVADAPVVVPPTLEVTAVQADGVDATIEIDGKLFVVSSRLESRAALVDASDPFADSAPADEMVRSTTVRLASGVQVASFSVAVDDGEVTGTVSGQSFGHPDDETSDDDAALWASITGSADGHVVDVLSLAASASLDSGVDASAAPFVTDISELSATLHDLATPPLDDAPDALGAEVSDVTTAAHHMTTLGWDFASGPNRRILLVPNAGGVIGIHSAANTLAIDKVLQTMRNDPTFTLGIREVEPYEYNTSRAYRRMVGRLVAQAQQATPGTQSMMVLFNSGRLGSHDPMSTLPGGGAGRAARTLRALLRDHPEVRLSIELYCAGNMTALEWANRRAQLGRWAAKVRIPRARVTVDEDLSSTTASSGEHYGTLGNTAHFNAMLLEEATHVFHGGWGGVDYVATGPTGTYPTLPSTFDVVRNIMTTYAR
jgi:hypothetical protein